MLSRGQAVKKSLAGQEEGQDDRIVARAAAATEKEVIVPVVRGGMDFSAIAAVTGRRQREHVVVTTVGPGGRPQIHRSRGIGGGGSGGGNAGEGDDSWSPAEFVDSHSSEAI